VTVTDRWVLRLRGAGTSPRVRLICIPYAGGSPEVFRPWSADLAPDVELLTLQLPGRGVRLREPLYEHWKPLLDDTFAALEPYLGEPHAFYGHSFGGRLAYELTHLTETRFPGRTRRLFVGGCRSPDVAQRTPLLHTRTDEDFRAALLEMGGSPAEVLGNDLLMAMLLPTIRSEIRLAEMWEDRHPGGVLAPITAVCGRHDPIDSRRRMRTWPRYSRSRGEVVELDGGHFFLTSHGQELVHIINTRLEEGDG
jgi:medium-chain acyl-[acyl-carrier-protein] hydrolase